MNDLDYQYHYDNLEALDVDQLCSDLRLTTQDILAAFPQTVARFIKEEFG